ncbi:MAG: carbon-nitrogen hydrolase family protein [Thermoleophilaceae bacterium]
MGTTRRCAAIQLEPRLGDVAFNIGRCRELAAEAVADGAEVVVLPEFFTTGMAYLPEVVAGAVPYDGPALALLRAIAANGVLAGGSFLATDDDGEVRNAFVLAGPDGVLGRHDKDLPTMWENAAYVGGSDDGVIGLPGGGSVGVALCWELMRSQTVRRLAGRVDAVLGGSAWWSIPPWRPRRLFESWERDNRATAIGTPAAFARMLGVPLVHASHCGELRCPMPWTPCVSYSGRYEGPTSIVAGDGTVLAERSVDEGEGIVVADVELGAVEPSLPVPGGFWLHRRGPMAAFAWNYQRAHGRRAYRRRAAA